MSALDYFLKANLYGLLLAGCYWLFLRRHTFLTVNRAYLLLSAVLSLALPLASLPAKTVETLAVPVGVIVLPVVGLVTVPVEANIAPTSPDWEQIGQWVYWLIAFGMLLRLAIQSVRVLQLIRRSERQVRDGYALVRPRSQTTPTFSFFRYVVLNPADAGNELILSHELVHVRQRHSADVLGLAILRAVFWPVLALAFVERALRHVHEFLADRAAMVSQASPEINYAQFLVEYTFGIRPDVLTNGFFNPSLLKQRILMLHQRATNRWALGKYVLVLPLIFALLAMTTAQKEIAAIVEQATDEKITVSGRVTGADGKPLPGAHILIAGSMHGTYADAQGRYVLKNVPKNASLAYSFIGHRTDILLLESLSREAKQGQLTISPQLKSVPDELPAMGATAAYKAIKPNPAMPVQTPASSATIDGAATTAVEEPAVFPTGVPGLMQYVAQNLRYPAKARTAGIEGDVYVLFTVSATGAVSGAKVNRNVKRVGGGCEDEAVRVVSQMPKWLPARQQGKPVAMRYMLPVRFALEKADKRTGQTRVFNNSTNARFALYDDLSLKRFARPDSNPAVRPDSVRLFGTTRRPFRLNQAKTEIRNPLPINMQGEAELFLLNGTKQIDRIESINPDDIDYLHVEKGEEAIAKYRKEYGEKAAKGVVSIYLKSAKSL